MSEPRAPRPLTLPRFAVPISLIVALLAVAAFAAVACRGEAEVTPALGVVAPVAVSPQKQRPQEGSAEDEEELEEFVPTEKVSADKSVSFPVDI